MHPCERIKPHDKAAARLTYLPGPFSLDAGRVQNACGSCLEHVQDASEMCAGCIWDACKRYLGAELYLYVCVCVCVCVYAEYSWYRN